MERSNSKGLTFILIILVACAIGWAVMHMPDQRTGGQKVGDAIDALPHGVDKSVRELGNRTPGEKLGDAVKDAGENIKDASHQ